jgi:signal transduction histidine kinase
MFSSPPVYLALTQLCRFNVGSAEEYTDMNTRFWRSLRPGWDICLRFALVAGAIALATPAEARTAEEAQALAERAVAHIRAVGREHAFADFSRADGGFVDGELYVFCQDASGIVVAHGGNPRLVGQNMSGVRGPDGRLANVEINQLGLTQGSGWLEFRWPNPVTKRIELKAAYVLRVDDHTVCGSGYYKGSTP